MYDLYIYYFIYTCGDGENVESAARHSICTVSMPLGMDLNAEHIEKSEMNVGKFCFHQRAALLICVTFLFEPINNNRVISSIANGFQIVRLMLIIATTKSKTFRANSIQFSGHAHCTLCHSEPVDFVRSLCRPIWFLPTIHMFSVI